MKKQTAFRVSEPKTTTASKVVDWKAFSRQYQEQQTKKQKAAEAEEQKRKEAAEAEEQKKAKEQALKKQREEAFKKQREEEEEKAAKQQVKEEADSEEAGSEEEEAAKYEVAGNSLDVLECLLQQIGRNSSVDFPGEDSAEYFAICAIVSNAYLLTRGENVASCGLMGDGLVCAKHCYSHLRGQREIVLPLDPMNFPDYPLLSKAAELTSLKGPLLGLFSIVATEGCPYYSMTVKPVILKTERMYERLLVERGVAHSRKLMMLHSETCVWCTPGYLTARMHASERSHWQKKYGGNKNAAPFRVPFSLSLRFLEPYNSELAEKLSEKRPAPEDLGRLMRQSEAHFTTLFGRSEKLLKKKIEWIQKTDLIAVTHSLYDWTARFECMLEHHFYFDDLLHPSIQEALDREADKTALKLSPKYYRTLRFPTWKTMTSENRRIQQMALEAD